MQYNTGTWEGGPRWIFCANKDSPVKKGGRGGVKGDPGRRRKNPGSDGRAS